MSPHRSALVSPDELAELIRSASDLVVLDVRWRLNTPSRYADYLAAHVPGAQWCDLETDLADPPGLGGRHPLPNAGRLQSRISDWGINAGTTVIAYDLDDSVAAARAWWVLRWAGIADVRVLDGGWAAWVASGHEVSTIVTTPAKGTFEIAPGSMASVDAAGAARAAEAGVLVDVRVPERFHGETEPVDPVAGRIPGAVNYPTGENVQSGGQFRSHADLSARFAALKAHPATQSGDVAVYCGSGVNAAHTVLALHEVGINAALYPGSWSEWITDPARPIATGP